MLEKHKIKVLRDSKKVDVNLRVSTEGLINLSEITGEDEPADMMATCITTFPLRVKFLNEALNFKELGGEENDNIVKNGAELCDLLISDKFTQVDIMKLIITISKVSGIITAEQHDYFIKAFDGELKKLTKKEEALIKELEDELKAEEDPKKNA